MAPYITAISQILSISLPVTDTFSLSLGGLVAFWALYKLGDRLYVGLISYVDGNELANERALDEALMAVSVEADMQDFYKSLEDREIDADKVREWELYDDTEGFGDDDLANLDILNYIESVGDYEADKFDDLNLSTFGALR